MKKVIFWTGLVVFFLSVVCFFLSGSTSGPTPDQAKPTVGFLYGTNQFYWILLGLAGLVTGIVGLVSKKK
jgi:hypothetical protein